MRSEIKFGGIVHSDGTITKRTILHFEEEEAMWRYYDSLESDARVAMNLRRLSITINEEYVSIAEYRDFKFGVGEEE
tara:strand:- start:556 stop:786 length:231 start_codon:yes stop_codon:yes gene_type:complete